MSIFEDLEEQLKFTYNTSQRQSFEDLGEDHEERDKIAFNVTGSGLVDLNVDYSDFQNHIFFGSAYAASNFALARIIRDFPSDGELKEKNKWRETNTGYENWYFDNFPRRFGYFHSTSGTNSSLGAWVIGHDHQGRLGFSSGSVLSSFTLESVIKPAFGITGTNPFLTIGNNQDKFISFSIKKFGTNSFLTLDVIDLANGQTSQVSANYNAFEQSANHVAASYDNLSNLASLFVNGNLIGSGSITSTGSLTPTQVEVGHFNYSTGGFPRLYFTGQVDDVRIWNSSRSQDLISRNHYRTIHANHSGGLKLYWKFNEPSEYGNKVVDYSGCEIHGQLTGAYSHSVNMKSGSIVSWFRDVGDPILALNNTLVDNFVTEQRNSGTAYDEINDNMIFNLVPGYFTEGDDTEYQQLFLLLTARHYDRLKLYVDHISNVTKATQQEFNGPPDELLDLTARHYGVDLGGIYSSAEPLQNYFGENVYSTGSMEQSLLQIKNTIKRNIVSNLNYFLKTKSTQESLRGILHAIGLNDNIVSISEFTDFSGGVKTVFSPKTVERKVARFSTTSKVNITSSVYSNTQRMVHQFRALFNTGSSYLSQSLISMENPGLIYGAWVERENLTSSNGVLKFFVSGSGPISSSLLPIFNGNWINFSLHSNGIISKYFVSSIDHNDVLFEASGSATRSLATGVPTSVYLGSSGSNYFDGHMQEYRAWIGSSDYNDLIASRWGRDWDLLEVPNFYSDYSKLKVHLKLDDGDSGGFCHNYANGETGNSYSGFSSSLEYSFPGKYIDKHEASYSYDLNIDNDKIRIREGSKLTQSDENIDIPFVSIDFSPIVSLNKEIMKWVGDIERVASIATDPLYAFRDDNTELNSIRSAFFRERVNSKINYSAFSELIKWFDTNFAYLLSQFIPADMAYSISNFVIEPHLLEHNKVRRFAGVGSAGRSTSLEANVSAIPVMYADAKHHNLGLADPGRYGAFVSASAQVGPESRMIYSSSSVGLNFQNELPRKVLTTLLSEDFENSSPTGYGNGFYTTTITGSEYLKNTLNVNRHFAITGVSHRTSGTGANLLSSSHGRPTGFTGTFNGYQDARWLWDRRHKFSDTEYEKEYSLNFYNFGIGYGGLYGQLSRNRSLFGKNNFNYSFDNEFTDGIGEASRADVKRSVDYIKFEIGDENTREEIYYPNKFYFGFIPFTIENATIKILGFNENESPFLSHVINVKGYKSVKVMVEMIFGYEINLGNYDYLEFSSQYQFGSTENLHTIDLSLYDTGLLPVETVVSSSYNPSTTQISHTNIRPKWSDTRSVTNVLEKEEIVFAHERDIPVGSNYMRIVAKLALSTASPTYTSGLIRFRLVLNKDSVGSDNVYERKM